MNPTRGIPKRLTPDPIIECNFEIRFSSDKPENEILGILFDALKKGYPTVETTNLPSPIRQQTPNLQYYPEVFLKNEGFRVGIGKKAISISCSMPYVGWRRYQPEIASKLQALLAIPSLVKSIDRVGIRYINFFTGATSSVDVFDWAESFFNQQNYHRNNLSVRTEFSKGDISFILNTADNAISNQVLGSLVDIDVSCAKELKPDPLFLENLIENLHTEEKKVFFSLLKQELVDRFNPEYEGA